MAIRICKVDKGFNDFEYFRPYINEDGSQKELPIGEGLQIWDSVRDAPLSPIFDTPEDVVKFGVSFGLVEGATKEWWEEKVDFELNVRLTDGDTIKAFEEHRIKWGDPITEGLKNEK